MRAPSRNPGIVVDEPMPIWNEKRLLDSPLSIFFRGHEFPVGQLSGVVGEKSSLEKALFQIGEYFNEHQNIMIIGRDLKLGTRDAPGLLAELYYKRELFGESEVIARDGSMRRNLRSLKVLAWLLEDQENYVQAEIIYRDLMGGKHEDTHLAKYWYGRTLWKQGQWKKAQRWLREASDAGVSAATDLMNNK